MTKQVDLLTIRANDDHRCILFVAIDDGSETAKKLNDVIEQYGIDVVRRKCDINIEDLAGMDR